MAVVKQALCLLLAIITLAYSAAPIQLLEHKAETQRLHEEHQTNTVYDLHTVYSEEAREIAKETFGTFKTDKCGATRCFIRVKSDRCTSEYRCYALFIRKEPYSTRHLVRTYFQRTYTIVKKHFDDENTKFGCVIHVMNDKAEINCVYMKMKNSAIARS
ncbi:uncharacterized protein LOC134823478 [Bolinopsis microptera]|uniref:uncharacterized protein LOC134823478 n=1 Tax=Bolinopsis microptera TaxID=2820187 RepID=UPI003079037A